MAQRQLRDALERVLRSVASRAGWALLALRLSRLPLPGPQPHHKRVAAALLDEVAERCSGQLFGLNNGDLVLLFRPGDDGAGVLGLVAALFGAEVPDVATLRSLWRLPQEAEAAQAYVTDDRLLVAPDAGPPRGAEPARAAVAVRGMAVRLHAEAGRAIVPLFREAGFERGGPGGRMGPFDDEDRAAWLPDREQELLARVRGAIGTGDAVFAGLGVPLNLPLTPAGVLSMEFARFASVRAGSGVAVTVELALGAAHEDPGVFLLARERLRLTGMGFVLGQVTGRMLSASRPGALDPDLVKLEWDPGLAVEAVVGRLASPGLERVVLSGCDAEAAVAWGLDAGIRRFQGGFVDTMLAARRLRQCPAGGACTIGLCRGRGTSLSDAVRAGCRNPELLDAAVMGGS